MTKNKERCKDCIHRVICLYKDYYANVDHLGERCSHFKSEKRLKITRGKIDQLEKNLKFVRGTVKRQLAEIEELRKTNDKQKTLLNCIYGSEGLCNAIDKFRGAIMDEFLSLCNYNDYNKLTLLTIGETVDRVFDNFINEMRDIK